MSKYHDDFIPEYSYHCFNHAVGSELLYRQAENYRYFLKLYNKYIAPIADLYAYCLMPNHFHFLIRFKNVEALQKRYFELKKELPEKLEEFVWHKFLSQQFSNFFNAYAKAYNKRFERRGALFEDYVKRIIVDSEDYFYRTLRYIHINPVHHDFIEDYKDWSHSSYHSYFDVENHQREVIRHFDGLDNFIQYHNDRVVEINDIRIHDMI